MVAKQLKEPARMGVYINRMRFQNILRDSKIGLYFVTWCEPSDALHDSVHRNFKGSSIDLELVGDIFRDTTPFFKSATSQKLAKS